MYNIKTEKNKKNKIKEQNEKKIEITLETIK